jgi:hypothetical protein
MKGYKCTCDSTQARELGDLYTYPRQVVLDLPQWSIARKQRLQSGLEPNVSIDGCIAEAIKELWDKGIETTGCCCGHNYTRPYIGVHPDDYLPMFELGYVQRPVELVNGSAMGLYSFYPKDWITESICQSCGNYNPIWSAPNELFNKVNGSPNGILCPNCFEKKADNMGIHIIYRAEGS